MPYQTFEKRHLVTVPGQLDRIVCRDSPSCILTVSNNKSEGQYRIPLSLPKCHELFCVGDRIVFRLWSDAMPDDSGVFDTAGSAGMLWRPAAS